ncbi:MAG TPA: hypothetical protein VF595_01465 [Tepidisphaeraceae bacterium]|jgi:hypothetical protein
MTRSYARAVALIALLASTAFAQVDRTRTTKTPAGDPAGVQRASCVLQIDFDSNRGNRQFDSQTLNALLTSTTLVDPAAMSALRLEPDAWPKVAQVELTPAGNQAVRLGVTILPGANLPPSAAQMFLDALAASAKTAVEKIGGPQDKTLAERLAKLEAQVAEAQKKLDAATAALAAARPTSFNNFDNEARFSSRNLATERVNLELNLAGHRARLKALDEEMSRLRPSTQPVEAGEPLSTGRSFPMPSVSGLSVYDRFEVERITLRLNVAENQARVDAIAARMAATGTTTQPSPGDYERLQQERNTARSNLSNLQNQLEQARRERQSSGTVRLLILDGRKPAE